METRINIAEILRNKPQGTKLYSLTYGDCFYQEYTGDFGIECQSQNGVQFNLDEYGRYCIEGECILFPSKEMQDWEKFAWKRGDVLVGGCKTIVFDGFTDDTYTLFKGKYCLQEDRYSDKTTYINEDKGLLTKYFHIPEQCTAQAYIKVIEKRLGGKLDLKTLGVEKEQPEFKDGDIVAVDLDRKIIRIFKEKKNENNICWGKYYIGFSFNNDGKLIQTFKNYTADCSSDRLATEEEKQQFFDALAKEGKAWDAEKKQIVDLKPKVELKPFDKVLVRDYDNEIWHANLFSNYISEGSYGCVCSAYKQCVPYEGNEHLLGTRNNPK